MQSAEQLGLFFGLVLGIVLLPGLDMTFVLATALGAGRRAGFAGVLGLAAAGLVHVAVGAAGLAAAIALVPGLFNVVLVAGALYLGWIGVTLARSGVALPTSGDEGAPLRPLRPLRPSAAFRRGMATNLLNPKAYAFMLAVFPQFLRPDGAPVALQALPLAAIVAATQIAVYGTVVVAAGAARSWLGGHPRALLALGRGVGAVLVAGAAFSVWESWRLR